MASARNGAQISGNGQPTDFEGSFKKLQEVVRLLSEGNLTLQESLAAFEDGMGLAERCASMLEQAELRVKEVSERAKRGGASALLGAPLDLDVEEPDVLAFEFERTVIVESGLSNGLDTEALDELPAPTTKRASTNGKRTKVDPLFDELDPLFDEED